MRFLNVDLDKCVGCRLCEMVCSLYHDGECSTTLSPIKIVRDHEFGHNLVRVCCQCEDAPCIDSCLPEALYRNGETGAVLVDDELCNGCGVCIDACPISALFLDEAQDTLVKCDLCGGKPHCVKVCDTEAITLKEEDISSPERKAFLEKAAKLLKERVG